MSSISGGCAGREPSGKSEKETEIRRKSVWKLTEIRNQDKKILSDNNALK